VARLELTREGPFDLAPERFLMTQDAKETKSHDAKNEGRPSFRERLLAEVKNHPFGYTVLAIFVVAGPIGAPFLFPQAPPAAAIVGGLAFGVYAALSAVPQKFM
jgi:hypothetical protein